MNYILSILYVTLVTTATCQVHVHYVGATPLNCDTSEIRNKSPNYDNKIVIATSYREAIESHEEIDVLWLDNCSDLETATGKEMVLLRNVYYVSLPKYSGSSSRFVDSLYLLQSIHYVDWKNWRIPLWVGRLTHLRSLSVPKPSQQLQDSIASLQELQYLHMYGDTNKYTPTIPLNNSLCKLSALEVFVISGSCFVTLPDSIGQLRKLKKLDISYCPMRSFPENFCDLDSLEVLWITEVGVYDLGTRKFFLPDNFGRLRNLKVFFLNGPLTDIPESFGDLAALERLQLSNTGLTSFPLPITRLKCPIEYIIFDASLVRTLPDEIGQLGNGTSVPNTTSELYLERCWLLTRLPGGIRNMRMRLNIGDAKELIDISALDSIDHPFELELSRCAYGKKIIKSLRNRGNNIALTFWCDTQIPRYLFRLDKLNRLTLVVLGEPTSEWKARKTKRLKAKLPNTEIQLK